MHSALNNYNYAPVNPRGCMGEGIYDWGVFSLKTPLSSPLGPRLDVTPIKGGTTSSAFEYVLDFIGKRQAGMAVRKRLFQHVLNVRASTDVDALTQTTDAVLDAVLELGPENISLFGLQPARVNGEHLAALLRMSLTWKDVVPGWADALVIARASIELSGEDPEDILFGMI